MTFEESRIKEELDKNSIIFFKHFIDQITSNDNGVEDEISKELVILCISSLQISLELAMKSALLEHAGLKELIMSKNNVHRNKSLSQLLEEFEGNTLKTLSFENVKNFVRKNEVIPTLDEDDFEIINDFQRYRNGMVHLSYNFSDGDYFDLKYDIIYFAINILIKVLYYRHEDLKPSEYLEYEIGQKHYKKLLSYKPYLDAMSKLAKSNSSSVLDCFFCSNSSYAKDKEYCYVCNMSYEDYALIDCSLCNGKNSMIYDDLNLELNFFSTKGFCLICKSDSILFSCPECETVYNLEANNHSEICVLNKCINR